MQEGRPIPLCMRRDLIVTALRDGFHVKDPISLQYFRLDAREFTILNRLDGRCSAAALRDEFRRCFPDSALSAEALGRFLTRLTSSGLVFCTSPGPAERRLELSKRAQKRQRWLSVFSWLSFSIRGIHPGPILQTTAGIVHLLLAPLSMSLMSLLLLVGTLTATMNFERIAARLPSLAELTTPQNLVWLALAWIVIKLLHEFGHAAVCHYCSGECTDVGIMFLVGMPLFYCDVSDAWMFRLERGGLLFRQPVSAWNWCWPRFSVCCGGAASPAG